MVVMPLTVCVGIVIFIRLCIGIMRTAMALIIIGIRSFMDLIGIDLFGEIDITALLIMDMDMVMVMVMETIFMAILTTIIITDTTAAEA